MGGLGHIAERSDLTHISSTVTAAHPQITELLTPSQTSGEEAWKGSDETEPAPSQSALSRLLEEVHTEQVKERIPAFPMEVTGAEVYKARQGTGIVESWIRAGRVTLRG